MHGSCQQTQCGLTGLPLSKFKVLNRAECIVIVSDVSTEEEEEDVTSVLRDRSHIDETLRLATEQKAGDYAGEDQS